MENKSYQFAIFECIEHFQIATALTMIKVGNMLPEAINSGESQEPLRVNFPGIPEKASNERQFSKTSLQQLGNRVVE